MSTELGPRGPPGGALGLAPTHGATGGEQVDYVVVKRCDMVGNKDPDAVIPESGVLLPGHEPQYRTHGPYHEPGDTGGSDCAVLNQAQSGGSPGTAVRTCGVRCQAGHS